MTIYDIAKAAKVSPSTVSRVMNNKPGISEETRKRVLELLSENNYEPNITARSLSEQSSKTIGLLVADIRLIYYSTGIHIIANEMAKLGYCCIILNTGVDEVSRAEFIQILRRRQVDGAIVIGSAYQNSRFEEAIRTHIPKTPVILINGSLSNCNVYGLLSDERKGAEACADLLYSKGCRHLVFVSGTPTISSDNKLSGICDSLKKHGIAAPPYIYQCKDDHYDPYYVTKRFIHEHPETDGVFYSSDCFASPGIRALLDSGFKIPENIKVIAGDDSAFSYLSTPKITSMDGRIEELCYLACENIYKLLNKEAVQKQIIIPANIIERETT
jgi:LacI family transcriptional regulator